MYQAFEFSSEQQWLEWRRGGVGSSDATILAAHARLITPPSWMRPGEAQALFWEKLGLGLPKPQSEAMKRGKELEETARRLAEQRLGFLAPLNLQRRDVPWLRASFDGLTMDDEIVEIKVPHRGVVDLAKAGEVVDYYRPQIAHQLMVLYGLPQCWSGQERWHFAVYDHEQKELHLVSGVSRDLLELAQSLYEIEAKFMSHVLHRVPLVGGSQWFALAQRLVQAKKDVLRYEALREVISRAVQEQGYEPKRFSVKHWPERTRKTTDWAAILQEAGIDKEALQPYRGEGTWSVYAGSPEVEPLPQDFTAEQAEQDAAALFGAKEVFDQYAKQARDLAQSLDETLIGPLGLAVRKREGALDYAQVAKDFQIPRALIARHTQQQTVQASIGLVARTQRSKECLS